LALFQCRDQRPLICVRSVQRGTGDVCDVSLAN
jgi:hypothetical protein